MPDDATPGKLPLGDKEGDGVPGRRSETSDETPPSRPPPFCEDGGAEEVPPTTGLLDPDVPPKRPPTAEEPVLRRFPEEDPAAGPVEDPFPRRCVVPVTAGDAEAGAVGDAVDWRSSVLVNLCVTPWGSTDTMTLTTSTTEDGVGEGDGVGVADAGWKLNTLLRSDSHGSGAMSRATLEPEALRLIFSRGK